MRRSKINKLFEWKKQSNRKPLIINGARQVGKSWLVNDFANEAFGNQIFVINFERSLEYFSVFEKNLDPYRILSELTLFSNKELESGNILLFLDEIQQCPNALMSLRYFYEELPHIPIIAAGSLLDFSFRDISFPVGRVQFMTLFPMTFLEFLWARGKDNWVSTMQSDPEAIPDIVRSAIYDELDNYIIVGGMPECVATFCQSENFSKVREIQSNLMYSYRQDFRKYKPQVDNDCLNEILVSLSTMIGNQTIYSKLTQRFTNPTIKKAYDLLITARLIYQVQNVHVSGLPLMSSGKQFKTYFLDIGIIMFLSGYDTQTIKNMRIASFEGMVAEQFVAQQIISNDKPLNFWARTDAGSNSEVDFVTTKDNKIVPIEVKSGTKGTLRSLQYLIEKYSHVEQGLVYSRASYGDDGKIKFLPIYLAGI